jgi:chromosome segregation protein
MYLSKLEIIGFKSFCNRTDLGFDSGISAIVGPNGCGKTNIVDAIRWVLGEQRYSALRSEKMEDVIFNGTKTRKPLGMAEASLVIENTKGILPSEYTQVTIGRRVYRSGESEYLLNKIPCRLKDIQDLFMDTGMGADAYSVIELKMVESILSDKTDERRHLFEEAAGVTKYKHRRKAAYRKLENVQADLVRVNDIVSEVQKAVNTLERQAKRAEQHHDVRNRLRAMEIDLMEREFAQLHERVVPLNERLTTLRQERVTIDGGLLQEEQRLEELRNQTKELERQLALAQGNVSTQAEKLGRVQQTTLVAVERRKSLEEAIARFDREKTALKEERQALERGRMDLEALIATLLKEEETIADDLRGAKAHLAGIQSNLADQRTRMQLQSDKTIAMVHEIAGLQAEQDRRRGRVDNLQGRSARAADEILGYEGETRRLEDEIARLLAEDKQYRRLFSEAEVAFYDAENRRKGLKLQADEIQAAEIDLRSELGRKTATVEFLKGLIENREGISDGVKYLVSRGDWGDTNPLTVADIAVTDERFRPAIEAALGDWAGVIIVKSPAEADRAISLLKEENRGKATFVCLDRLPEMLGSDHREPPAGTFGWASALIRCDAAYKKLFQFILDRVLIVENIASANAAMHRLAGIRCITLDAEVVTGVGVARGGSKRHDEGGGIGKHQRLEEAKTQIRDIEEKIAVLRQSQDTLQQEHDAVDLKALQAEVKRIEKQMSGVEVRIAQLEFEKKRAFDTIERNRQEIETIGAEITAHHEDIAAHAPALERLKEEKGDIERRLGGLQSDIEHLERENEERSRFVNELEVRTATVRGDRQNATNDLKRTDERIRAIGLRLETLESETMTTLEEIASTQLVLQENEGTVTALREELDILESARRDVELRVTETREEVHRTEIRLKDERRQHDDSLTAVHDLELRIADLNAKAEHIVTRAREEFELTIELRQYPEGEFVDFAALRDEIHVLREKIKSLGNINFAAFEEYNTEKERLEFLTEQRKDLLEAEKTLLSTIEEINTTAQRKFLETFTRIRENFIETFKSLFDPGDECDLRLEEDVDPLEARIEITAKPRGKRPTSIDLLSGGEKTLTATALLFAIYLVKPSPFCILDEVDAPLDDANIDRFTRILRKFSDNTQFIVVTHNKRTMEAANALYGVTMEEEGVSKLVTVRFNQAGVRSAALVSG